MASYDERSHIHVHYMDVLQPEIQFYVPLAYKIFSQVYIPSAYINNKPSPELTRAISKLSSSVDPDPPPFSYSAHTYYLVICSSSNFPSSHPITSSNKKKLNSRNKISLKKIQQGIQPGVN